MEDIQVAVCYRVLQGSEKILLLGSECVPIYGQFTIGNQDNNQKILTNTIGMFDRHFELVKNVIYERVKLSSMKQRDSSIHQFIMNLQAQANNCEYGAFRDELVQDRIVVGVCDPKLSEYLIDIENLDLPRCVQRAKQFVSHHAQAARMGSANGNVDALASVRRQQFPRKPEDRCCCFCGKVDKCPAKQSTCNACRLRGHWARTGVCKGKRRHGPQSGLHFNPQQQQGTCINKVNELDCEEVEGLYLGSESN